MKSTEAVGEDLLNHEEHEDTQRVILHFTPLVWLGEKMMAAQGSQSPSELWSPSKT